MKPREPFLYVLLALLAAVAMETALGQDQNPAQPVPISAEEAFDAVAIGIDGIPPEEVLMIDVRDPVEYFSSGAAAKVTSIKLFGQDDLIEPDFGKARLIREGKFLEYVSHGRYRRILVDRIEKVTTAPLAYNLPFWYVTFEPEKPTDENSPMGPTQSTIWDSSHTDQFYDAVEALADELDASAVIFYCRTGGRSSKAGEGILANLPTGIVAVYEIDSVGEGTSNCGGFSGAEYSNVYNGHAGFPGRETEDWDVPATVPSTCLLQSVSWLDSGLPVTRAFKPLPEVK